jgi:hypothetical protein
MPTSAEAFSYLGVTSEATEEQIRTSWREKVRNAHPDSGGSHEQMIALNEVLSVALRSAGKSAKHTEAIFHRDLSTFTISADPHEAWSLMVLAAAECGSLLHSETPVCLEFTLHDTSIPHGFDAWCRCDLVAEFGHTTVHVEVGATSGGVGVGLDHVRNHLIAVLNALE